MTIIECPLPAKLFLLTWRVHPDKARLIDSDDAPLTDTCCFTTTLTQVEQTRTTNPTGRDHLNFFNAWRMECKGFFNTHPVGDLTNREGGIHFAALPFEHHPLKHLDALFIAFNDPDMYLNGIAGSELRDIKTHLLLINFIQNMHSHSRCFTAGSPSPFCPRRRMPPNHPGIIIA